MLQPILRKCSYRCAWRMLPLFAAILACCVAPGCGKTGPERVSIRGEVMLDDQPLKSGRILFVPKSPTAGPTAAGHIVDGVYEIADTEGAVVGTHRVEIKADIDLGFPIDDDVTFAELGGGPLPPNPVPQKYNQRSELSAETTARGPNEFNFMLASEKPAAKSDEIETAF